MFRQEFELDTYCKKIETAFNRFKAAYGVAWEVWGEVLEYMAENDIDHLEEEGWSLWLDNDEGHKYIDVLLLNEVQRL